MASEVVIKFDRFKVFPEKIKEAGTRLVTETANAIKADAAQVWSFTDIPFRIRFRDRGTFAQEAGNRAEVIAGDTKHWYSLFLENGTQDQGARPAMTPAAERSAPRFFAEAKRLEKKLG